MAQERNRDSLHNSEARLQQDPILAHGIIGGKAVVVLEFFAHADVREEYDAPSIDGNIHQKIIGRVHGGTVAAC